MTLRTLRQKLKNKTLLFAIVGASVLKSPLLRKTYMSSQTEAENKTGIVVETLPNTMFKVQLEDGEEVLTYLSGRMRRFRIRVVVGDSVTFEVEPYGGKGRIIQRH